MQEKQDQPVGTESQSETKVEEKTDQFVPQKTAEEYAAMWRKSNEEAKAYRKKYSEAKSNLEIKTNEELKEQGKYKEMFEQRDAELTTLKNAAKRGAVQSQLQKELLALGCNPAIADKAIRFADLEQIDVDSENYAPDMEQVKFEAKRIKEEVPVFFGKGYSQPKDGVPGNTPAPTKSIKELSDKELDALYKDAIVSGVRV